MVEVRVVGWVYMDDPDRYQCGNRHPFLPVRANDPYDAGLTTPPQHVTRCASGQTSLLRLGAFQVNHGLRLAEAIDGTSKTAAVSELITVEGQDTRGAMHFGAAAMYMHDQAPNTTTTTVLGTTDDWSDWTRYCKSDANPDAPCVANRRQWAGQWQHNARSVHTGGVNLVRLDASVEFIGDDIDLAAWHAMATPAGEEVVSQ